MTKRTNVRDFVFARTPIGLTRPGRGTVDNTGDEIVTISGATSDITQIYPSDNINLELFPVPPASSTLFFGPDYSLVDGDGKYYTNNQGKGVAATTDNNSNITVAIDAIQIFVDENGDAFVDENGEYIEDPEG